MPLKNISLWSIVANRHLGVKMFRSKLMNIAWVVYGYLQVVLLQVSYFCCKCPILLKMTCSIWLKSSCKRLCCKWLKFGGSAHTGSLQMDLLQVPIQQNLFEKLFKGYWTYIENCVFPKFPRDFYKNSL